MIRSDRSPFPLRRAVDETRSSLGTFRARLAELIVVAIVTAIATRWISSGAYLALVAAGGVMLVVIALFVWQFALASLRPGGWAAWLPLPRRVRDNLEWSEFGSIVERVDLGPPRFQIDDGIISMCRLDFGVTVRSQFTRGLTRFDFRNARVDVRNRHMAPFTFVPADDAATARLSEVRVRPGDRFTFHLELVSPEEGRAAKGGPNLMTSFYWTLFLWQASLESTDGQSRTRTLPASSGRHVGLDA